MKRASLVTVLVLAAIAVIAAALPWWLGLRAERGIEGIAKGLDGMRELSVVEKHYQRGWLHGEGTIRIAAADGGQDVVLHQRVEHGPFPPSRIAAGRYRPLAAVLQIYSEDGGTAQGQRLIDLTADIGLGGVIDAEFTTGAFVARLGPKRELQVSASRGTVHVDHAGTRSHGTVDLSLPQFSMQQAQGQATFSDVDLRVTGFDERNAPGDIIVEQWKLDAAGLQFASRADGEKIQLQGVALDAGWSRPTPISDGRLSARCESLAVGGTSYGPARLEVNAEHIDRDALRRMDQLFEQARESGVPPPREEILNAFADAVRHGAKIALQQLTLGTGDNALEVSASLKVDGDHPDLGTETVALIEAIQLQLDAALPESMLRAFLAAAARRQYEQGVAAGRFDHLDDEVLNARIAQGIDLQIRTLTENGYLRRAEGRYTVEAGMSSGRLTVNGKPVGPAPTPAPNPAPG